MAERIEYEPGQRSAAQLRSDVETFWNALRTDAELRSEIESAGLDLTELESLDSQKAITIRPAGAGFDPATIGILVIFAPTANRVLQDLWTTVLLPRIRRRWGSDAIGRERRDGEQR